jgi:nucleoid-associated protein YgaU
LIRLFTVLVILSSFPNTPANSQESEDSLKFITGFNAFQQKDYATTITNMSEVLQKYPDSQLRDVLLLWLSRAYFKNGNQLDAARHMSQFLKEYPDSPLKGAVDEELLALTARYEKGEQLPVGSLPVAAHKDDQEQARLAAEKAAPATRAAKEDITGVTPGLSRQQYLYVPEPVAAGGKVLKEAGILVQEVSVRKGDTLYRISRRFSGHGSYYPQILLFNDLKNPDRIYPGNVLRIPVARSGMTGAEKVALAKRAAGKVPAGVTTGLSQQKYIYVPKPVAAEEKVRKEDGILLQEVSVRKGDTLYRLSRRFSGHGSYYPQILLFNDLKHSSRIYSGNILRIPVSRNDVTGQAAHSSVG